VSCRLSPRDRKKTMDIGSVPSSGTVQPPTPGATPPPTTPARVWRDSTKIRVLQFFQRFGALIALVIVLAAASFSPNFLSAENIRVQLQEFAIKTALLAVGQTLVILTGGIDLSVGSLLAVGAALSGQLALAGYPMPVVFGGPILLCTAIGVMSGTIIARTRIQPIVVTLAVLIAARGVARLITGDQVLILSNILDPTFGNIATTQLGPVPLIGAIPVTVVLAVAVFGVVSLFLARTAPGRYIFAVGGNERAARLSGVASDRVKIAVYAISGGLAGLAGVLYASFYQNVDATTDGLLFELTTIASVVIGGTSLLGGTGGVWRTFVGALILVMLGALFTQMGLSQATKLIVQGLVIVGAVALQAGSSS